jgi:hypothetical protein
VNASPVTNADRRLSSAIEQKRHADTKLSTPPTLLSPHKPVPRKDGEKKLSPPLIQRNDFFASCNAIFVILPEKELHPSEEKLRIVEARTR